MKDGRHPAAIPVARRTGIWWRELLWGAPGFFTTRTELFVLCLFRAAVYPVLVLYAYVAISAYVFDHTSPSMLEGYWVALLFPFFEEHARLVVAKASNAPVVDAVGYSLVFGIAESILMIPIWLGGTDEIVESWSEYMAVRGVGIAAHVCWGVAIGWGASKRRGIMLLVFVAAVITHALFNLNGVGLAVSGWLLD